MYSAMLDWTRVESGVWRVVCGEWCVESGVWRVELWFKSLWDLFDSISGIMQYDFLKVTIQSCPYILPQSGLTASQLPLGGSLMEANPSL